MEEILIFKIFLLGMVESSLYEGPIYFNYHPNYSLSLYDPTLLHALELNIKTDGYEMMKGAQPLTLVYIIYYKLMKATLETQSLIESPKDKLYYYKQIHVIILYKT